MECSTQGLVDELECDEVEGGCGIVFVLSIVGDVTRASSMNDKTIVSGVIAREHCYCISIFKVKWRRKLSMNGDCREVGGKVEFFNEFDN